MSENSNFKPSQHFYDIRKDEKFLSTYREIGDCFPDLLARVIFLSKYCRDGESWTDFCARIVYGNALLVEKREDAFLTKYHVSKTEQQELFHRIFKGQILPGGRALWTGGVENIPAEAKFNCWVSDLKSVSDFAWITSTLMTGGGVGISLLNATANSDFLIFPSKNKKMFFTMSEHHKDFQEVKDAVLSESLNTKEEDEDEKEIVFSDFKEFKETPVYYVVEDTREGWARAIYYTIWAALSSEMNLELDFSCVRERGAEIKTFGGIACGPGPLALCCKEIFLVIQRARDAGKNQLAPIDLLDISCIIGKCVKSGNVRRSALLILGKHTDVDFVRAKEDTARLMSWRHTSNNSIAFEENPSDLSFDFWKELAERNIKFGDPGIVNLWEARKDENDKNVVCVNPCGEIFLEDRESCNLIEVFPAVIEKDFLKGEEVAAHDATIQAFKLAAAYNYRQRLEELPDATSNAVNKRNMRLGVAIGGVVDSENYYTNRYSFLLNAYKDAVKEGANEEAAKLGLNRPVKYTTVKPSGTISLLNGSSPGMHAPHSKFWIRRVRFGADEPMAACLKEANVPFETCVYDASGRTLVFEFPQKSTSLVFGPDETPAEQLDRQMMLQNNYADNAVSATISYDSTSVEAFAEVLRNYIPYLKSSSFMSRSHGYAQPPLESITKEDYLERIAKINMKHALTSKQTNEVEIEECAGGACPIK